MPNWRRPLLHLYDTAVARSKVPACSERLTAFYRQPIERQRPVQAENLAALLRHAARHVPHYRTILRDRGVVEGEAVDLTRFRRIPELTRDILRARFEDLKSDDLDTRVWHRNSSGGSTGEPVVLLQDDAYDRLNMATIETHYALAGRGSGDPMIRLWGSERDVLLGSQGWRNRLSGFVRNQTLQNAFRMSEADILRYIGQIRRIRPVLIEAYSESIYELARYMNRHGIEVRCVKSIVTTAATLYPFIRDEVERAFQCPILNRYGSREVGNIATERTGGDGLAVFTHTHWVEVVDADGAPCAVGEEGDVLVTCLSNHAMPIIRYRLGDRAVVGAVQATPTPSVEVLQTVTGRANDALLRADGTTVPGIFFMYFLSVKFGGGWLKKFQIVQRDYDDVLIKLILLSPPPSGLLDEIATALGRVLGAACRVHFSVVDSIAPQASGKYRYVVCDLARREG